MKGIKKGYRLAKHPSFYRKMSDRIKPTSKGAFLQMGTIKTPKYDDEGNMISWQVQDLSETKTVTRKKRKRKPKKVRTILRKCKWGNS